jgi:response regulator RpfG family c-di-GMP phosphodiesterase
MAASILVVDDDEKVLEILEKSLTKKGYRVSLAQKGVEGLRSYTERAPDLVVLDLMLPDMDGRDVLKAIRSDHNDQETPVLFLSANADPNVKVSGMKVGAEDFLVKPFSLREFNIRVEKVLQRHKSTRELLKANSELEDEVTKKEENAVEMNKELKRKLLHIKTLFSVSQELNRYQDLDVLINRLALILVGELQLTCMAVFARSEAKSEYFSLLGLKGFRKRRFVNLKLGKHGPFTDWLRDGLGPRKLVRSKEKEWAKKLPDLRLAVFEYAIPMIIKDDLVGIVFTGPKMNKNEFTDFDLELLTAICNSAAVGIENAWLFKQIQTTYYSTIRALVSIIEAKDTYTLGHTERVADYAVAMAARLQLSREERRDIAFGAVLHDIGKLGIFERLLNKDGKLDEKEWEIMKRHPEVGAGILENMEFLAGTVPMVKHHHERYDGAGYPDGLQGDDIPIGARIITVADSFDAMTTDRPYRKAMTWEEAIATLRKKAGMQFDPVVVDRFIEILEARGHNNEPPPKKSKS